jgi:hypothetical protein
VARDSLEEVILLAMSAFTAEFDPMFATGPNVESNLFKDLP